MACRARRLSPSRKRRPRAASMRRSLLPRPLRRGAAARRRRRLRLPPLRARAPRTRSRRRQRSWGRQRPCTPRVPRLPARRRRGRATRRAGPTAHRRSRNPIERRRSSVGSSSCASLQVSASCPLLRARTAQAGCSPPASCSYCWWSPRRRSSDLRAPASVLAATAQRGGGRPRKNPWLFARSSYDAEHTRGDSPSGSKRRRLFLAGTPASPRCRT